MTPHTLHLLIFMVAATLTLIVARAIGAYINRRYLLRNRTESRMHISVSASSDKNFGRK